MGPRQVELAISDFPFQAPREQNRAYLERAWNWASRTQVSRSRSRFQFKHEIIMSLAMEIYLDTCRAGEIDSYVFDITLSSAGPEMSVRRELVPRSENCILTIANLPPYLCPPI